MDPIMLITTQSPKAHTAGPISNWIMFPSLTNMTSNATNSTSIMLHLPRLFHPSIGCGAVVAMRHLKQTELQQQYDLDKRQDHREQKHHQPDKPLAVG